MVTQPHETEDPSTARAPGAVLSPPEVPAGSPAYPPESTYPPPPSGEPGTAPSYFYPPPVAQGAPPPAPAAYAPPVPGPANTYHAAAAPPASRTGGIVLVIAIVVAALLLGLIILLLGWVAISRITGTSITTGQVRTESQSVQLAGAQTVDVTVSMGAGNVTLSGGAPNMMDADFTYNVDALKPQVNYNVNGTSGTLAVREPDIQGGMIGNTRYEWNLRFNNDVPMKLTTNTGAGNTELRLGTLNLSRLTVNSGAGNTTMDLSGTPRQNLEATINGGVGNTTVRLPAGTGVRVVASGGLGKVTANGFTINGDTYTNDVYGKTPVTLNITVKLGVGNVTLETVR